MDSQQPPGANRYDATMRGIIDWNKHFESDSPPRLGMEVGKRLRLVGISAFSLGAGMGLLHGSKTEGYRFRAENAHRYPTSTSAWLAYHQNKNYAVIVGGVKDGVKSGSKLAVGALAFCLFEETADWARNDRRDFVSTVTAGLSFSGIYSLLCRHDIFTAARTTKLGLKFSLAYGLIQDALESAKGNRPAYVNFILGNRRWSQDGDNV